MKEMYSCKFMVQYDKLKTKGCEEMGKNLMTDMETAVMNLTGCSRQIANTVANTILNMEMEANREFEIEQENNN